jgi:hypothetical protein
MNKMVACTASAVVALVVLVACSDDDGPTTLAKGEDIGFIGGASGLSDQTMDISAEEEDGEVTGEARFEPAGITVDLQCADTRSDGLVVIGGTAIADSADARAGEWIAVAIREGDPDRVGLWFEADDDYGSCRVLVDAVPDDEASARVASGDDIETG